MHHVILSDTRPGDGEDAMIAMLDRRPGGHVGDGGGTQVIGMEAVIRHQNDDGVVAGFAH